MVILFEPLKTTLQLTEVLIRAIPLTIIALGISVAYRSGIINIGGEGQMAMGILGTTAVALAFPELPKPILLQWLSWQGQWQEESGVSSQVS